LLHLCSHPIRKAAISHRYFFSCVVRAQVERRAHLGPLSGMSAAAAERRRLGQMSKCKLRRVIATGKRQASKRLIGISSPCTIRSSDSVGALMKSTLGAAHSRLLAHNECAKDSPARTRGREIAEKIARYLILLRFAWRMV
jgi:hypothetical protein